MQLVKYLSVVTLCFCALATNAAPAPEVKPDSTPQRVLFVGNSFSFFNNGIHNQVSALIKAAGKWQKGQRYRMKTLSGGKLSEQIAGFSYLMDQPEGKGWDVVVLQGHSLEAYDKKMLNEFNQAAQQLVNIARQHQVQPVFFMTWPFEGRADMTDRIATGYTRVANASEALVVPVGLAFAEAAKSLPGIDLYHSDVTGQTASGDVEYSPVRKHPSMAGTYLAACVFYATFYQQSPLGNPYTAGLEPEVATQLQQLAWQTYQQFYGVK